MNEKKNNKTFTAFFKKAVVCDVKNPFSQNM